MINHIGPRAAVVVLLAAAMPLCAPAPLSAQERAPAPQPTVTVAAGPQYAASPLKRFFLGDNWRELWTTPVRVPVLDLGTFAGGLTPEEQGGGNQSITLHMEDAEGREWIFRSIDKYPGPKLPAPLRGAPAGAAIEDQISALNPGAHFVLPGLLEAVGILHLDPVLYIMPDDPRLGEFQDTFAGMLGELEEIPNEGPDDTPGWAGSTKIKGSEEFLNDIEDSADFRLDAHEYAAARLLDFLVGDPDRGTDQWRWARYGEEGDYEYRPIPRDRDWAFVRGDGQLAKIARGFYPKLTIFEDDFPDVGALTFSSYVLDRWLLTELTRADFLRIGDEVERALTDDVIAAAVRNLPPEYYAIAGEEITADLIARRDLLADIALAYYAWLSEAVDVRATDERDLAAVERRPDGTVQLRISRLEEASAADNGSAQEAWFDRVFVPGETREVRVFLHGDDDRAIVTGTADGPIVVRIIGGGGDDVLEDRTGAARLYDHRGDNEFLAASGTDVDTRPWEDPETPEGFRADGDWAPSFGSRLRMFSPTFDYGEGAGVIVGAGPRFRRYGFRHLPYEWSARANLLYATRSGGVGVEVDGDYHFENSPVSFTVHARAVQFDAFRFYGFGNDTPELDPEQTLVLQDHVLLHPALQWQIGRRPGQPESSDDAEAAPPAEGEGEGEGEGEAEGEDEDEDAMQFVAEREEGLTGWFSIGPAVQWSRPESVAGTPVEEFGQADSRGYAGALARLELSHTDQDAAPRRGYRVHAQAAAYPLYRSASSGFGSVAAELNGFVPLIGETHLALRVGGERVFGSPPVYESAFIGGRHSLRGFRSQRFAGDGAVFGGVELRMPVDSVELIFNGELGVFALADAGRVWHEGETPGGWHTAWGGGAWFSTFDHAVSVAYARGEDARFYAWWGLPF